MHTKEEINKLVAKTVGHVCCWDATGMPPETILYEGDTTKATGPGAGLDSLDMVELAMEIEDAFGIEIPDDDFQKIKTVGDLNEYVAQALNVTEE